MEFFRYSKVLNFMGRSKLAMAISGFFFVASLILLATKGLNYGIDFAGGTIVQVKYESKAPLDEIRKKLESNSIFDGATTTEFGSPEEIVIRMKTSTANVTVDIGDLTRETLKGTGKFEIRRVDIVGPKIGSELKTQGLMSLLLTVISILIYVGFRFEWKFAVASVLALVHDATISMGAVSLASIDVNLDVLAAILTLLGYSLNDTIIVFDRIREEVMSKRISELSEIINDSVTRTLSRTILTSFTVFIVVFTLYMFGGEIIHAFAFTLLVGVVVGTYSSIFIASPTLMLFRFDVKSYNSKLADKAKREVEKQKMRDQFESGVI